MAGGRGERLGGLDKPGLLVGGAALIERAVLALAEVPVVVVGPFRELTRVVHFARESPPGGGPAAAICAGVAMMTDRSAATVVAILAADLPAINAATLHRLAVALDADPTADGAVLVDAAGRDQWLISAWRLGALRRTAAVRPDWAGAAVRTFFAPLTALRLPARDGEDADIDDPGTLARWQTGPGDGGPGLSSP